MPLSEHPPCHLSEHLPGILTLETKASLLLFVVALNNVTVGPDEPRLNAAAGASDGDGVDDDAASVASDGGVNADVDAGCMGGTGKDGDREPAGLTHAAKGLATKAVEPEKGLDKSPTAVVLLKSPNGFGVDADADSGDTDETVPDTDTALTAALQKPAPNVFDAAVLMGCSEQNKRINPLEVKKLI